MLVEDMVEKSTSRRFLRRRIARWGPEARLIDSKLTETESSFFIFLSFPSNSLLFNPRKLSFLVSLRCLIHVYYALD